MRPHCSALSTRSARSRPRLILPVPSSRPRLRAPSSGPRAYRPGTALSDASFLAARTQVARADRRGLAAGLLRARASSEHGRGEADDRPLPARAAPGASPDAGDRPCRRRRALQAVPRPGSARHLCLRPSHGAAGRVHRSDRRWSRRRPRRHGRGPCPLRLPKYGRDHTSSLPLGSERGCRHRRRDSRTRRNIRRPINAAPHPRRTRRDTAPTCLIAAGNGARPGTASRLHDVAWLRSGSHRRKPVRHLRDHRRRELHLPEGRRARKAGGREPEPGHAERSARRDVWI